jgi:general secretion pathway protein G
MNLEEETSRSGFGPASVLRLAAVTSARRVRKASRASGRAGGKRSLHAFTLLEIMIVVGIIVILLGLAITKMGNPTGFAKSVGVRADVQSIGTQLRLYESMNGFFPTTEQGLKALVQQAQSEPRPTRWYQLFREVPKDPWGKEYIYRSPGIKHPESYDLYSAGPNRIDDNGQGDDDWGE